MKKQLHILLFALLVVLMVGTMVVVASAAETTEGATDANYQVETDAGNKFYPTIAEAIEAVKENGTITLLKNVAEESPSLGVDKTYTIDGAGFTMTLTPAAREYRPESEATPQAGVAFHIWLGHVTLKNVTLDLAAETTATVMIFIQNKHRNPAKLSLTLENVVAEFTSKYGIWLHQEATVTIKGANTKIKGGTTDMIRMQGGSYKSTVNIEAGTFTSTGSYMFDMIGNGGKLNVSGGSFTMSKTAALLQVANATMNITGGTFTSTAAAGANVYMFHLSSDNTTINISGKDTLITATAGVKAVFCANNSGSGKKLSVTDATVDGGQCWFFGNSATTVDIAGTATFKDTNNTLKPTAIGSSWTGAFNINSTSAKPTTVNIKGGIFEWSKDSTLTYNAFFYGNYITFNVGNFSTEEGAPAADIQFNTIAKIYAIRTNTACKVNFNNATITGTKYYVLDLRGAGVATVDNCTITSDDKIFTTYGTANLTINSGKFTAAQSVVFAVDGTINVNGGELTGGASQQVIAISGGTLNITGGTLKAGNNVIRTGSEESTATITINISGGSLTNTGGGNQLIRANSNDTKTVYVNILPGANLVQNQNQYVVRVQTGTGIINMTGGTVVSTGTYTPFGITTGDGSKLNITGGTVVTNSNIVSAIKGTVSISNCTVVMTGAVTALADYAATVSDVAVLFKTETMKIDDALTIEADIYTPTVKFAGELYTFYMEKSTNAAEDIVTDETAGAQIYFAETEAESGIRFTSYLSESAIALVKEALAAGKTVSYGTLIAPADYVVAAGAFTKEALGKLTVPAGKAAYADIPLRYSGRDSDGDGVYEAFSATLINIKEENLERAFASVAYVTIDGTTYYSAYNTVDNARSVRQVANDILNDTEFDLGTLTDDQLNVLLKYLGEY